MTVTPSNANEATAMGIGTTKLPQTTKASGLIRPSRLEVKLATAPRNRGQGDAAQAKGGHFPTNVHRHQGESGGRDQRSADLEPEIRSFKIMAESKSVTKT